MLRFLLALAAGAAVSFGLAGTDLAGLSWGSGCTTTYTIQRGDTLSEIAERVYGKKIRYHEIVAANRGHLADPAKIEVGDTIILPCPEPAAASVVPPADPQREAPEAVREARDSVPIGTVQEPGADSPEAPVRLVTAASFAPFADPKLARGGLLADLVTRALARTGSHAETQLTFVDNLSVPVVDLAGTGFELSFPWFKPDCSAQEALSPKLRRLCTDYVFSGPLHEVSLAVYALAEGPLTGLTDHAGLAGKPVCVPAGLPPMVPGRSDPFPADVTMAVGPDTADCMERLMRREVAAVAAVKLQADHEIGRLGLAHAVGELTALTSTRTLHALAPKSNPGGVESLASLDRGLEIVKKSGEWFRVVSAHNLRAVRH
jgi:polar amino acid transport system substrate-binding protein